MFFVQFASFRKGDHFAPFDFPVDCLESEASLKHNEQWTFMKFILISLDDVHTRKNHLVLFRLVYLATIIMGLKSHTHGTLYTTEYQKLIFSSYTYHEYTSKYKNNHVEPSILSLHWIFLYSSRYHTTIPPYIQSRSGAFKNTTSIQYTMFFQFTIPTVLKQWKICVKRSKIPFDWAYVIHGHFHMHRINEIPLIYINKNSDIQSYRNEISMPMFP